MYYASTLFSMVGFDKPTVVSIVVGATNFIFGFPNFIFIDRFGRRRMLLVTILGMASILFKIVYIEKEIILIVNSAYLWWLPL